MHGQSVAPDSVTGDVRYVTGYESLTSERHEARGRTKYKAA